MEMLTTRSAFIGCVIQLPSLCLTNAEVHLAVGYAALGLYDFTPLKRNEGVLLEVLPVL